MKITRNINGKAAGALALALAMAANLALAGPGDCDRDASSIAPPNSHAYGKSLTEWLGLYWRWFYSGADPAQDMVGPVKLMPQPNGDLISGTGTPADPALYRGQLEITLPEGTPFVLPEFAWVGERYEGYPAVPDDPPIANGVVLAGVHLKFTIDGKMVLSDANKAAYYVPPTEFDPIVEYPTPTSYGSVAAVFFQGDGVVVLPLSSGRHVIHLVETVIIPAGAYPGAPAGFGVAYDNTWIINVVKPPHICPPGHPRGPGGDGDDGCDHD